MPRNGSGTMNPSATFTPGTNASATAVNDVLADMNAEITNSVAADGQTGMTGPLKAANGSAAAPSITTAGDTNTGFYWISADKWGFSVAGTLLFTIDTNGLDLATGKEFRVNGTTSAIPAGSAMLFIQTAAPAGWTKSTTHDNKAIRIVSGTASTGGSVDFTSAFSSSTALSGTVASHTLSLSEIPAHTHTWGASIFAVQSGASANMLDNPTLTGTGSKAGVTSSAGSGAGHSHGFSGSVNLAVKYVDAIICTKN